MRSCKLPNHWTVPTWYHGEAIGHKKATVLEWWALFLVCSQYCAYQSGSCLMLAHLQTVITSFGRREYVRDGGMSWKRYTHHPDSLRLIDSSSFWGRRFLLIITKGHFMLTWNVHDLEQQNLFSCHCLTPWHECCNGIVVTCIYPPVPLFVHPYNLACQRENSENICQIFLKQT